MAAGCRIQDGCEILIEINSIHGHSSATPMRQGCLSLCTMNPRGYSGSVHRQSDSIIIIQACLSRCSYHHIACRATWHRHAATPRAARESGQICSNERSAHMLNLETSQFIVAGRQLLHTSGGEQEPESYRPVKMRLLLQGNLCLGGNQPHRGHACCKVSTPACNGEHHPASNLTTCHQASCTHHDLQ